MPGGGYEAGTGGCHSQAQAGMTDLIKKKFCQCFANVFYVIACDCVFYQEERRRQEMVELQQEMGIQVIKDGFFPHKQVYKKTKDCFIPRKQFDSKGEQPPTTAETTTKEWSATALASTAGKSLPIFQSQK